MRKSAITKEQKLRLVTSFVASVVCLCCFISLTLAWFADNRRVDASGLAVSIRQEDVVGIIDAKYYNIIATAEKYTFSAATDENPAALGKYSLTDDRYQMLMKLYIKADVTSVRIKGVTKTDYFLGDGNHPLLAEKEVSGIAYQNVLSSCISISALSEGEITENKDGTLKISSLPSAGRTATFIDRNTVKTEGAVVKQTADTEIITLSGETVNYGGVSCRTVYLLFSYDPLLMSTIFSYNISNKNLEKPDGTPIDVPFVCDFSLEIVTG